MDTNFDDIFASVGQKYGIDPALLKAQALAESGLDPSAVGPQTSSGQAQGISQLMPATAKSLGVDPTDPVASIDAQARLLKQNLAQFGTPEKAVLAYHGGTDPANWGPKTGAYLQKVSANYQQLKGAAGSNEAGPAPQITPQDDFEKEALGASEGAPAAKLVPQDDFEKEALASSSSEGTKPAAAAAPATAQVALPAKSLSISQLDDLQQNDPTAYKKYMDAQAANARAEFSYGAGDIPRSVANIAATYAPETYGKIASAVSPAYQALGGNPLPTTPEALTNELQQRNAEYQQQYGGDPHQAGNRLLGEAVASGPVVGKAAEALGGLGVASNAVVDPATGAVIKASSLGNKLLQYGVSGAKSAALAAPITALTNAGSDVPVGKQLTQNAVLGGALGAAAPAAADLGAAAINKGRQLLGGSVDAATQKAQNVLQQLVGGDVGKLDTTEYVPGVKPTLAQAAVENPNVAALDRVLKEGNPTAGQLVVPELTDAERQQDMLRRNYLDTITGSPEDLQAARDARSSAANLLLYGNSGGEAAAAASKTQPSIWESATKPTDVKPVVDTIDSILQGPDKKNSAVQAALGDIKDKLVNSDGSLESDPETLYRSVIKDINTKLDKANPLDQASQNMQSAAVQVQKVKSALNAAITDSTPGYKDYLKSYTQLSQPVDEMNVLQNKLNFLNQPSDQGVPTLAKVNKALDSITKKQNASGISPYDSVSNDTINKLQNLQKDLQRAQNPTQLLRNVGSPTDPKIAARQKVEQLLGTADSTKFENIGRDLGAVGGSFVGNLTGLGPAADMVGAGMGAHWGSKGGAAIDASMAAKGSAVKNQLVQMLLNPENASSALQNGSRLLPSVGELPGLGNALSYAAPAAVQEHRLQGQ